MNFDSNIVQVAIEDIIPNRFQPRLIFEDDSLNDLANSIKQHGIIQPLVLRKIGDKYEIVAGERRYKASRLAGLDYVPAVIAKIDDKTSAEIAVVENVQRRELTGIEEAKSYKALLDQGFMSEDMLAQKMGIPLNSLINKLKLLELSPEVQTAMLENKISERHGRSLLILNSHSEQNQWLNRIIDERLTVRQLDLLMQGAEKGDEMNQKLNIETMKQNATDININYTSQNDNIHANQAAFTMEPIDLGSKTTSKFFNSLEDEEVNMQMTEAVNPFNHNNFNNSPKISAGSNGLLSSDSDILDSLDFTPPSSRKNPFIAKEKINALINELKNDNYDIEIIEETNSAEITLNIKIK